MALFNSKGDKGPDIIGQGSLGGAAASEEEQLIAKMDQLESEKKEIFAQIGQEYYESDPEDLKSEEMEACFKGIADRDEEYSKLNDQLRALRGITSCPECGADIMVTDTFCATCGARIISEITVGSRGGICPNCGHQVEPGQMFCSTCGAKINISETIEEEILEEETKVYEGADGETIVEVTAQETDIFPEEGVSGEESADIQVEETVIEEEVLMGEDPAANDPRICSNCGRELDEGVKFCMFCGQPVEVIITEDGFPDDSGDFAPEQGTESETGEQKSFCINCGAPLEPGDAFCINCGHKVE